LFSALLSPQIRHLDVTRENLEMFLDNERSLPVLCPSVESLHILTLMEDVRKPFPTSRFIPQRSSLYSLTGGFCVDSALLNDLRGRPKLGKLEFCLLDGPYRPMADTECQLREVDSLILDADSYEDVSDALDLLFRPAVRQPSLDSLPVVRTLHIRSCVQESAPSSFLTSPLSQLISHSDLRSFHITHKRKRSDGDYVALSESLRCLSVFHNLTSFSVEVETLYPAEDNLSGAQLGKLVLYWPRLETLRVSRLRDRNTFLDVLDLITILRACPTLKNVLVNVLVKPDDELVLSTILGESECFSNLVCMRLEHYPGRKKDVESVALLLANHAPHLAHMHTEGRVQWEFWEKVAIAAACEMGDMMRKAGVDTRPCQEMVRGFYRFV